MARRAIKLSTLLFVILLGLGIVPAAVLFLSLLPGVIRTYDSASEQQGLIVAQQQAGELTQRLERRRETVRNIAMLPAPLEMLRAVQAGGGLYLNAQQAAERFGAVMRRWFTPADDLRMLSVLDLDGIERFRQEATGGALALAPPTDAPRHGLGERFGETLTLRSGDPQAVVLAETATLRLFTPILALDGNPAGMLVMDFDLNDVLAAYEGAHWVDAAGHSLHAGTMGQNPAPPMPQPGKAEPTVTRDASGRSLAWVPLRLGRHPQDVMWVGSPVDHSRLRQGMLLLAGGTAVVFALLVAGLMIAVRAVTLRLDDAKKDLMAGLHRMIAGQRGVRFDWRGPAEVRALGRELTQLGRLHANTVRALRLSRFSVEHAGEGILWVTPEGAILFANEAVCEQLGYGRDEMLALNVTNLNPRYRLAGTWNDHWRELSDAKALVFEANLIRKDGSEMIAEVAANHLTFEGQDYDFAFIRDISERKAAAEKLLATVDELSRTNAELERFAHVAAHDLQEPVRSVVSFAQLLERRVADRLEREDREILDFLVSGAMRMHTLVLDLLAYAQMRTDDSPLADTDCAAAMASALEALGPRIAETGAIIEAQDLPYVVAEPRQLSQVFRNLISNALKFTRPGVAPVVRVTAQRSGDIWVISVTDNGIGIDATYADQLFTLFRRLHGARYPGTGLGLAVCKRIVERHGGRIWLNSTPGEGTSVHFTLRAVPDGGTSESLRTV